MKRNLVAGLLCLLPVLAGAAGLARTPQEEAMCQAKVYSRDTSDRENWQHMHQYCDCIRFTNRAHSALGNWYEMEFYLKIGIAGCDYVLSHTKPDFYMRPEVRLQKGKALRLYKKEGEAITEFMEAIKGNPELAGAYVELADTQARNKKLQEALKTVSEGLRHAPDSKPLKRRYAELGGKLPYPEPVVKKSSPAADAAAAATTSQALPESQASPSSAATMPPEANVSTKAEEKPAEPPTTPPAPAKIGSPTNPHCRFCPD
jgi:tetratricopeptide (TPR) repeat protein